MCLPPPNCHCGNVYAVLERMQQALVCRRPIQRKATAVFGMTTPTPQRY